MNVNDVKDEARKHKLMYKYFEINLSKPTDNQIAKTILSDEECDKVQSENNLSFLSRVRGAIFTFLQRNELDYKKQNGFKGNSKCECECDYDCECNLNKSVMPSFKKLVLSFEPYMNDDSLVNHILEEYTAEEKDRLLSCDLREVLRLILYKELAYLAFDNELYDISCWHHEATVLMYGGAVTNKGFDPSEYIESELSARAKKANEARWQGHVEQLRRKYLGLDKQRQSELGKKLTIKSVATWIYEHHNQDDLVYETIRDHLSKARKGEFAND